MSGHSRAPSVAHPGHRGCWKWWLRSRYSVSRALKAVKWMVLGGVGCVGVGQAMC